MRTTFVSPGLVLLAGCFLAPGEETLTLSGLVLAESGAPIADATVELLYREPFSSWTDGLRIAVATTNGDGRYVIVLAPPRTHDTSNCLSLIVAVAASGYQSPIPRGIGRTAEGTCDEGAVEVTPIQLSPVDP